MRPAEHQTVLSFSSPLSAAFEAFDATHPDVWQAFERYALQIAQHRRHYSADAVLHRVRWEAAITRHADDDFVCNNNWCAFYARKFARVHPELAALFSYRKQSAA